MKMFVYTCFDASIEYTLVVEIYIACDPKKLVGVRAWNTTSEYNISNVDRQHLLVGSEYRQTAQELCT